MAMRAESTTGDLSRTFIGGTAQQVEDGIKARDAEIWLFVSSDWAGMDLKLPNLRVSKNHEIPCHCQVLDGLLMCSCMIVLSGKQCGSIHLGLVAHCREFLWSVTPPSMTRREVEGSGWVDYLNIIWAIDSDFRLYRNVTSSAGLCEHVAADGSRWDAFWYIYRRGDNTPGYSHIGLDTSASLHAQKHVADKLREAIDLVPYLRANLPVPSKKSNKGFFGNFFSRSSRANLSSRSTDGSSCDGE